MTAPTLDDIRKKMADKIFGLDPTLAVHEYERYTKNMSDLVAMYKSGPPEDPRLRGLHIRNITTKQVLVDTGRWSIWHTWRIRRFMAIDDADESEKIFDTEGETIRIAFRDDDDLGGLIMDCTEQNGDVNGLQKLSSNPVLFAGVLCHSAEHGLTTHHLE